MINIMILLKTKVYIKANIRRLVFYFYYFKFISSYICCDFVETSVATNVCSYKFLSKTVCLIDSAQFIPIFLVYFFHISYISISTYIATNRFFLQFR